MTDVTLNSQFVRLEPLAEAHRAGLRAAADVPRIWEWTLTDARGPGFDEWFEAAGRQRALWDAAPVCRPPACGRTARRQHQLPGPGPGSPARRNRFDVVHAGRVGHGRQPGGKLLLLAHAFDTVGWNRVALQTDVLNKRSRAAIEKLGRCGKGSSGLT
jgi:hypothetical protein